MKKVKYERPLINRINAGIPDKFGMSSKMDAITHIDGIPVKDLIDKYGSPVFVLSEKTIKEKSSRR